MTANTQERTMSCPRYIRRRMARHERAADTLASRAKPVPGWGYGWSDLLALHFSTNRPTRAERQQRDAEIAEDVAGRQAEDAAMRFHNARALRDAKSEQRSCRTWLSQMARAMQNAGLGHLPLLEALEQTDPDLARTARWCRSQLSRDVMAERNAHREAWRRHDEAVSP